MVTASWSRGRQIGWQNSIELQGAPNEHKIHQQLVNGKHQSIEQNVALGESDALRVSTILKDLGLEQLRADTSNT